MATAYEIIQQLRANGLNLQPLNQALQQIQQGQIQYQKQQYQQGQVMQRKMFMDKLQNQQKMAQQQNQSMQPTAQSNQQNQNPEVQKNRMLNVAYLLLKFVNKDNTLKNVMDDVNAFLAANEGNQENEEAAPAAEQGGGKEERTIEGGNDDGSLDDENAADLDGDGVVTDAERSNYENFLVSKTTPALENYLASKLSDSDPDEAEDFKLAQVAGTLMKGVTESGVQQAMTAVQDTPQAAPTARKPSSPFSMNPFDMKGPTPL